MKYFLIFYISLIFVGCSQNYSGKEALNIASNEVKYAKGFSMETTDSVTLINVYNPWDNNSVLATYKLSEADSIVGDDVIHVPVESFSALSSTYIGMLSLFDAQDKVVASSNSNWICDSLLYQRYLEGNVVNLGNDMSISSEAVISVDADVVLKYIYQSAEPMDQILRNAGIPVVYIIEFMEEHPLGRAEWLKLIGALLGKKEQADSVFNKIESDYLKNKDIASKAVKKPSVVCGSIYKGTWYAAGGRSYIAQLLRDANSEYYWSSDSSAGSLPLAFETVISKQKDADFWLNANVFSLSELQAIEARCNIFKAFTTGNVYHYTTSTNENGGLDYYESGVVRPDLLLRDLITILHPDLLDDETVYYNKLK